MKQETFYEALGQGTNSRAGDHEANSQVFCEDSKYECESIVWKMATAEVEEDTARSLRGRNVGVPVTLGSGESRILYNEELHGFYNSHSTLILCKILKCLCH